MTPSPDSTPAPSLSREEDADGTPFRGTVMVADSRRVRAALAAVEGLSTEALELGAVQRQAEELEKLERLIAKAADDVVYVGLSSRNWTAPLLAEADRIRRKGLAAEAFERAGAAE